MTHPDRRTVITGLAGMSALSLSGGLNAQTTSRKLGYAVVGLGGYAERIMSQFSGCQRSRLVALVSGTPAKLEKFGTQYGIPKTHRYSYADYDRIRDNPDIDVVYVVLPNSMHAEYSIRAAKAGKHVMCEKPMAVSAREAEAMVAASRAAGRKLMIGYRSQFEQHNRHAIDLVKRRVTGAPRLVTSEHGFNAQPGQWRLDRALSGGGSLMDIGIYSLQAARYLMGEEPVAVNAMESTDRSDPRFRTVEDRIDFQMKFPSGAIANCVSSYSSGHNAARVTGKDGWVGMEPATPYEGHRLWVKTEGAPKEVKLPAGHPNQWVGQLDHMAEAVERDIEPTASGMEGLRDMRLIEAIYRSAREGRTIRLA